MYRMEHCTRQNTSAFAAPFKSPETVFNSSTTKTVGGQTSKYENILLTPGLALGLNYQLLPPEN